MPALALPDHGADVGRVVATKGVYLGAEVFAAHDVEKGGEEVGFVVLARDDQLVLLGKEGDEVELEGSGGGEDGQAGVGGVAGDGGGDGQVGEFFSVVAGDG